MTAVDLEPMLYDERCGPRSANPPRPALWGDAPDTPVRCHGIPKRFVAGEVVLTAADRVGAAGVGVARLAPERMTR